jgi:hypothetical protein
MTNGLFRYFLTIYGRLFVPRNVTAPGIMCGSKSTGATTHHNSFNPNCTWRELVAVEVTTPAVGEGSPVAAV